MSKFNWLLVAINVVAFITVLLDVLVWRNL
jgi:hypothetical protein